jgi:hypothetical protein
MKDFVQWTAPSPLWETAISHSSAELRRAELSRPGILRFATDSFMEDFLKMAENDPKRLNQYLALPETWRGVAPFPDALQRAPAFAKNLKRLGLIAARKKAKIKGLTQKSDKFTDYANSPAANRPLKLYQPAHQRFYMITACLVCERPGLPDKIPDSGREEKVTYVIRRLFLKDDADPNVILPAVDEKRDEYAYVITDQGARWKKVADKSSLEPDEEQQPLFSVNILEDDGRRRKIFAGVIPTGRREAYIAAGKFSAQITQNPANGGTDPNKPIDSRVYTMRAQFRDPWRNLLQTASHAMNALGNSLKKDAGNAENVAARNDILKTSREQIQTISWLILLDFANFLESNLPGIWDTLRTPALFSSLNDAEKKLVNVLTETVLEPAFATDLKLGTNYTRVCGSLKDALLAVKPTDEVPPKKIETNLEKVKVSYDRKTPDQLYPTFLFPLADPTAALKVEGPVTTIIPVFSLKTTIKGETVSITPTNFQKTKLNQTMTSPPQKIKDGEDYVNEIARMIEEVLKLTAQDQPLQMPPLASQTPMDMREGWFVIRCVYERPLCGAIDPPVLSLPTSSFQIAGFFDPDAPARPIRIALPVDTTPAGLRKFDRNTAFMMSDLLCGQVNRMKGITFADLVLSVLPFPFHKSLDVPDAGECKQDGLSVGMMCSLSIPIITICALILLMIIVALLDFIFKWLPFLIFCFPLPGLKAKDE